MINCQVHLQRTCAVFGLEFASLPLGACRHRNCAVTVCALYTQGKSVRIVF